MSAVVVDQVYSSASVQVAGHEIEAQWIERIRRGDHLAFEQLVRTYQHSVYRLLYRMIGDGEEARDLAQETFLKVYQKIDQFRGEADLKTWILRIAANQAINHRRWWLRRWRHRTLSLDEPADEQQCVLSETISDQHPSMEQALLERERDGRLARALLKIKPAYRVAVVLRDIEGLSYEQIAAVLKISVGTVKSRIWRGRELLRQEVIQDPRGWLG